MEYKERRQQNRIHRRFQTMFGIHEPIINGFSKNLSRSGMTLTARKVFDPRTRVKLVIEAPFGEIPLNGIVTWKSDSLRGRVTQPEMGISLLSREEKYVRLLEDLICEKHPHKTPPRGYIRKTFQNPAQLYREYQDFISKGCVFIPTKHPCGLNTDVGVDMFLLDILEVYSAHGRVVQAIDPSQAKEWGQQPGICVELTGFDPNDQDGFFSYIENLRQSYEVPAWGAGQRGSR